LCCLMTLSLTRLYSFNDRMINEYGTAGRKRSGRGNRKLRENNAARINIRAVSRRYTVWIRLDIDSLMKQPHRNIADSSTDLGTGPGDGAKICNQIFFCHADSSILWQKNKPTLKHRILYKMIRLCCFTDCVRYALIWATGNIYEEHCRMVSSSTSTRHNLALATLRNICSE
jgi:hypothetical protein